MANKRLLVEGWRGISHSFSMVNQHQLLAWRLTPGLDLFHHDLPLYRSYWNATAMSAGFDDDEAAALGGIPAPDGAPVDAVYRIAYPAPVPTDAHGGARQITFIVTEYGLRPSCFAGTQADLAAYTREGNAVVVPSRWSRELVVDHGLDAAHVHVVPHGVQRQTFRPLDAEQRRASRSALGFDDGHFVFANVGLASWNKGVDTLLTAFAHVHRRHPEARLVFKNHRPLYRASADPVVDAVEHEHPGLLSDEVLSAIYVIDNNLSQAELRELYGCADCYVSPYRAEGFNLPVLEAIACGTPVVVTAGGATDDFCDGPWATRVPGILQPTPESIKPGGRFIEIDLDALIESMCARLLAATDRRRLSGAAWQAQLEKFSWERVAGQALELCLGTPAGAACVAEAAEAA